MVSGVKSQLEENGSNIINCNFNFEALDRVSLDPVVLFPLVLLDVSAVWPTCDVELLLLLLLLLRSTLTHINA